MKRTDQAIDHFYAILPFHSERARRDHGAWTRCDEERLVQFIADTYRLKLTTLVAAFQADGRHEVSF